MPGSRCVTVVKYYQTSDQLNLKTLARGQIAGDEQRDRIMSESKTAANSKPLHPASASDCKTQDVKQAPDISALAEEVKDEPHTDSQPGKIRSVPVHQRPDLLTPCADLINSEWQRSQGARLHFLQKSCPEFPISLILLQGYKETEKLLGHARISRVIGHSSSLFVESVVVSKKERGKGYGRILMNETERFAKSRGFRRLCLTTHDKQDFYAHLGFVLSTPVQNAGSMTTFVPMEMLLKVSRFPSEDTSMRTGAQIKMESRARRGSTDSDSASVGGSPQPCSLPASPPLPTSILPSPPPPPPPLPTSTLPSPPVPISSSTLHPTPPSIPIPSSPPSAVVQTLTETPYRDAKGLPIFWMHKDI